MTLDSFLNFAVPAIIFIFLGVLVYSKAKEPLDKFFAMVKGWFQNMGNKDGGEGGEEMASEPSDYKIEYRGF